jgi:multidrug efflux pump subunit AcrA (membrane-fusion protein)
MNTSLQVSQVEIDEQVQEIARLQAELDYLNLQKGRFAKLTAEGATSQQEYDAVATEAAAKEAALEQANAKLTRLDAQVTREQARVGQAEAKVNTAAVMQGYTTLQSPISGIVQTRMVDPGVVVQPGMGVLKIGDYSRVRLQANVAQKDAGYIRVGTPIRAQVPGATDAPLTGSVTSIFPQTNNDTRTVVVEAVIDNPQGRLLSGQYLEMTLLTNSQNNALSVPQEAVVDYNGEPSVWVMAGTVAERRTVETGMVNGERIAITSGLNPGDQVITSGHSRLVPGVQVAMVDDAGMSVPMLGDSSQGSIAVAIVEPDPTNSFPSGSAELVLEVRDPDTQEPLPVKDVAVDVTMPMPNMAPMTTMVQLEPADQPGQFLVKTHFGMAGEWHIKVEVNDPDYPGQSLITVQVE